MTTAIARQALYIDYPAKDAVIDSSHYAIRLSAPEGVVSVEISIDRGPWQACRSTCGFWWHDWTGFEPGEHTVSARAVDPDGEPCNSLLRRFAVAAKRSPRPESNRGR